MPIIGSTSTMMRWFVLPMLGIALLTAYLTDYLLSRTAVPGWAGAGLVLATLAIIPVHYQRGINDGIHGRTVKYDPVTIQRAYHRFAENPDHAIVTLGGRTDVLRNESFINGASAQYCYEAALGYRLEGLVITTVPGPIGLTMDRKYNMLDPACFVYPHENRCLPGSRFDAGRDIDRMRALANYRPMPFSAPRLHHSLVHISRLSMAVIAALICLLAYQRWRVRTESP